MIQTQINFMFVKYWCCNYKYLTHSSFGLIVSIQNEIVEWFVCKKLLKYLKLTKT